jgi:putative ABC transport system permease protein
MPLAGAMRAGAAGDAGRHFAAGRWIAGTQIALSLVLLVAGGLLIRTFVKLATTDLGFDPAGVLVVTVKPPWFAADTVKLPGDQRTLLNDEIVRRLRAIPGVTAAARSFITPIGDDNWVTTIETDAPDAPAGNEATVYLNFVSTDYFRTLRMPLAAGREFDEHDTHNAAAVAVVNETLARRFFPGLNALGRRFRRSSVPLAFEVVGIVRDSKYQSVREAALPTAFLPAAHGSKGSEAETFELRTSTPPPLLVPIVQRTIAGVRRDASLEFHTLAEQVDDNLVQERLLATLSGFFAALALLLATIGLYGVLSYLVTNRQSEFGLRMALGAQAGSILRLVIADVAALLAGGIAAGIGIAVASVSLLEKLLFGLEPRDTATIVVAIAVLSATAVIAGYLPARRATRVDPMIVLRCE